MSSRRKSSRTPNPSSPKTKSITATTKQTNSNKKQKKTSSSSSSSSSSTRKRRQSLSEQKVDIEDNNPLNNDERQELIRLRSLEETFAKQPNLLAKVREDREKLSESHHELVKRLKSELAHWKASAEESKAELTSAKEALTMYRNFTNVSMSEHNGGYDCVAVNKDGSKVLSFHLTALTDGSLDYKCEEVLDPLAPEFLKGEINFDKGQGDGPLDTGFQSSISSKILLTMPHPWDYSPKNSFPQDTFSSNIRIRAGSLEEDNDQLGLAHLVEHLAFDNSKDYPGRNAIFSKLESMGLGYNAWTYFRNTCYQTWNAPIQSLEDVLQVHANQVCKLRLLAENLELEKGAVLSEGRYRNSTQYMEFVDFMDNHFDGFQLMKRWTIGDFAVIKASTVEIVERFIKNYYHPSRFDLQLVGDFNETAAASIQASIEKIFGASLQCGSGAQTEPKPLPSGSPAEQTSRPHRLLHAPAPLYGIDGVDVTVLLSSDYVKEPRTQMSVLNDVADAVVANLYYSLVYARLGGRVVSALEVDDLFEYNTTLTLWNLNVAGDAYQMIDGQVEIANSFEPHFIAAIEVLQTIASGRFDSSLVSQLLQQIASRAKLNAAQSLSSQAVAAALLGNGDYDYQWSHPSIMAQLIVAYSDPAFTDIVSKLAATKAELVLDAIFTVFDAPALGGKPTLKSSCAVFVGKPESLMNALESGSKRARQVIVPESSATSAIVSRMRSIVRHYAIGSRQSRWTPPGGGQQVSTASARLNQCLVAQNKMREIKSLGRRESPLFVAAQRRPSAPERLADQLEASTTSSAIISKDQPPQPIANNTKFGVALYELGAHKTPVILNSGLARLNNMQDRIYVRVTSLGGADTLSQSPELVHACELVNLLQSTESALSLLWFGFADPRNASTLLPRPLGAADRAALRPTFRCDQDKLVVDFQMYARTSNDVARLAPLMLGILRPYIDEAVLDDVFEKALLGERDVRLKGQWNDYAKIVAQKVAQAHFGWSALSQPNPLDFDWLKRENGRFFQAWLWAQLSPERISLAIAGGPLASALPLVLNKLLERSPSMVEGPLLSKLHVVDPFNPPWPDAFKWNSSTVSSRMECKLQHESFFHNKTEVLVGFPLTPPGSWGLFPFQLARRVLGFHMFRVIRSLGGYSYYAMVANFALSLNHAQSPALVVLDWQCGDYPTTHPEEGNVNASIADASAAMRAPIPASLWNDVCQGYKISIPYMKQLSGFHLDVLQYAGLRAPPSFERKTSYFVDITMDSVWDMEIRSTSGTNGIFLPSLPSQSLSIGIVEAQEPLNNAGLLGALHCN